MEDNVYCASSSKRCDEEGPPILFPTAKIAVCDANRTYRTFRCVINTCSMINLVTINAVSMLGLAPGSSNVSLQGVDVSESAVIGEVTLRCRPANRPVPLFYSKFVVVKRISEDLPSKFLPELGQKEFSQILMADPTFNIPGPVDLLLGTQIFPKLYLGTSILSKDQSLAAMKTIFGYSILGTYEEPEPDDDTSETLSEIDVEN